MSGWNEYNFPESVRLSPVCKVFEALLAALDERAEACGFTIDHSPFLPLSSKRNDILDLFDNKIFDVCRHFCFESETLSTTNPPEHDLDQWIRELGEEPIDRHLAPRYWCEWALQRFRVINALRYRYYPLYDNRRNFSVYRNFWGEVELGRSKNSGWPVPTTPNPSKSGFYDLIYFIGGDEEISCVVERETENLEPQYYRVIRGSRNWSSAVRLREMHGGMQRKVTAMLKINNIEEIDDVATLSDRTFYRREVNGDWGGFDENSKHISEWRFRGMGCGNVSVFNELQELTSKICVPDADNRITLEIPPNNENREVVIPNIGLWDDYRLESGSLVEARFTNDEGQSVYWRVYPSIYFFEDFYCDGGFKFRPEAES